MNVLICPDRSDLALFTSGKLDDASASEIASHLDTCSVCRNTLEEISNSSDPLAVSLRHQGEIPFSQEPALKKALEFVQEIGLEASRSPAAMPPGKLPAQLKAIRDYEILEKLGEGGMGAVYKARHNRLKKIVAIKVLPADRMEDPHAVARFEREMEAVGKLEHPHIVRAMDAGEARGIHFLVMEYVAGIDLAQLVRQHGPLPIADACELIRQAALGLESAHEHGLVHRDIKPSNLILSTSGTLKILDLGLALLGGEAPAGRELTSTGQMMGTLDYMAPEQGSSSHTVDIRADIYSLGATLYKLLTGQAPFGGEKYATPMQKMTALATETPAAVESLRTDVPPELAAIVHRLLARRPEDRPAMPAEVVNMLAPFAPGHRVADLAVSLPQAAAGSVPPDDPPTNPNLSAPSASTIPSVSLPMTTAARVPTTLVVTPKSARRRSPVSFTPIIALGAVFLLLGGLGIAWGITILIKNKKGELLGKVELPEGTSADVEKDGKKVASIPAAATPAGVALPARKSAANPAVGLPAGKSPFDSLRREEIPKYELAVAGDGDPAKAPAEIVAILGDSRMRHSHTVTSVTFLADNKLASASKDGTVRIWNTATGEQLQVLRHLPYNPVEFLSYDAADDVLMTPSYGFGVIWFWNVASGTIQREITGSWCVMSSDGRRLAMLISQYKPEGIAIVDAKTGETTRVIGEDLGVEYYNFNLSSDGRLVSTVGKDHAIKIWNADNGEKLHTFPCEERIISATFSPSGALFATRHVSGTRVFDLTSGTETVVSKVQNYSAGLTFTPDGKKLAYHIGEHGSERLELWDLEKKQVQWNSGCHGSVYSIAFSPNGKTLATGSFAGDVRLWDAETGAERPTGKGHRWYDSNIDVNAAGIVALGDGSTNKVTLRDLSTQKLLHTLDPEAKVLSIAFHPDGSMLAIGLGDGAAGAKNAHRVLLWDASTGKLRSTLPRRAQIIPSLAFAPDGLSLASWNAASNDAGGEISIWDWSSIQDLQPDDVVTPKATLAGGSAMAFSGKGEILAAGDVWSGITLWDVKKGKPKWTQPKDATGSVVSLAFHPEGGLVASAGEDGQKTGARLWDSATGEEYRRFKTPPSSNLAVAFSPNGQLMVVLDVAGDIHFYDPIIKVGVSPLRWTFHSPGVIKDFKFAADGRHLVTRNGNGTVYVLRLPAELTK